ncbi:DUF2520 domain-containing protein [uncultured Flavobacterium sp.]|uniref:Rossmann-like and DUF2520 domain-containing protein n=1 Tax=uncultured Flavobacterium sp. TaxID=165435 RepID=UPI0030EE3471|tara:strand:+ start:82291 stop:83049 length:759 start_codon:yes stop_codon:yes gene_type:complete
MIKVVLLGSGNVASHLIKSMEVNDAIDLVQVFARSKKPLENMIDSSKITTSFGDLKEADVYVISVSDKAIEEVSNQIPFTNKLVVHTSGTMGFDVINPKHKRGVFYPLQTFSKSKEVDMKSVPFCLETENVGDYKTVENLAKSLSNSVYAINGEQRKSLHISAVFVSNFVNHMYQIGNALCEENNVPFAILQPLIEETGNKIKTLTPTDAQTGPAIRNDEPTIQKHLEALENPIYKELYQKITLSIQNVKKL